MMHPLIKKLPSLKDVYIVGGTVRDMQLGQTPVDVDIGVSDNPEQVAAQIARHTHGRLVKLGRPGETLFRIVIGQTNIDITALKGTTIEDDLAQRDFTVNAMALDLSRDQIIDCHGGREDLKSKTIRMISERAFRDDPLRLLRAYRLASVLRFGIDPHTEHAIEKDSALIKLSAGERIREELFRMLQAPDVHDNMIRMAETGLLFDIFPEMNAMQGCIQNEYHHYDVLDHTFRAFFHIERIMADLKSIFSDLTGSINAAVDQKKIALLKCACLLHDIDKPAAKTQEVKGKIHFFRHEQMGAKTVHNICARLRFSAKETDFITFIVRNHLRPLYLFQAYQKETLTPKAKTRFFMKCGEMTPAVMLHAIADHMGKAEESAESFLAFCVDLLRIYYSEFLPKQLMPPLITGHDLINVFGLKPSPQLGKILSNVEELRLSKQINTKSDALKFVQDYLNSKETRRTT